MEYEIAAFEKSDFQDQNGNFWCNIALKGISEPVKIVVKDPSKFNAGDKIYGKITDETSKAGKPYQRFRREKAPDVVTDTKQNDQTDEYWSERNDAIRAQWAIGQAVRSVKPDGEVELHEIETLAKQLYLMVDRVKGYVASESQDFDPNNTDIVNLNDVPL